MTRGGGCGKAAVYAGARHISALLFWKEKKDIKQEIYKSSRIIFFGFFEKEMTNS